MATLKVTQPKLHMLKWANGLKDRSGDFAQTFLYLFEMIFSTNSIGMLSAVGSLYFKFNFRFFLKIFRRIFLSISVSFDVLMFRLT